ncbi:uncharacterized protein [Amphiura filiformis]
MANSQHFVPMRPACCSCCQQWYQHLQNPTVHPVPRCEQVNNMKTVETQTGLATEVSLRYNHNDYMGNKPDITARKLLLAEAKEQMTIQDVKSFRESHKVEAVISNLYSKFPTIRNSPNTRSKLRKTLRKNASSRNYYQKR